MLNDAKSTAALTLLEVLLSLTILAIVAALAWSWITHAGRASRDAQSDLSAVAAWQRVEALLRDDGDLRIAMNPIFSEFESSNQLELLTLNRIPGQAAGMHRITYRFDAQAHALWRRADPVAATPAGQEGGSAGERLISENFTDVSFTQKTNGAVIVQATGGSDRMKTWRSLMCGNR